MNNPEIKEAFKKAAEKILQMSDEELERALREHDNGWIAKALIELRYFED